MRIAQHANSIIATIAVAIMLLSCNDETTSRLDFSQIPIQVVDSMSVVQTENGKPVMRMSAPLMESYKYTHGDTTESYELFPEGFKVFAYTPEGELETTVVADKARHVTTKGEESWSAFGNVLITNLIKGEHLQTDTIYWNREEKKIYTDCYVKLYSYDGLMQGYGLTSDERASNSTILHPFDWSYVMRDSTDTYIDTLNFIGPQPVRDSIGQRNK